ncbi:MAG: J domain-containing protein [Phycisphaerae bacterium]
MARDYYVILGVAVNATPEQIKQAYRQKVLELHPDHYGPDVRPFLEVQEAYAVLSDPRRRDAYNRSIQRARRIIVRSAAVPDIIGPRRPPAEPLVPRQTPPDWGDVLVPHPSRAFFPSFDEIFNRLWLDFMEQTLPKPAQPERIDHFSVTVNFGGSL